MTTSSPLSGKTAFRILVVDDNHASAQTFGWMLEMLGHDVRLAHDGTEACAAARSFLPQVALLDINLPDMSGYDVCRTLRSEPALQDCVFVAQTGWDQPEHQERSRAAGFHHHLVKPVTLDRIESLLASLAVTRDEPQKRQRQQGNSS